MNRQRILSTLIVLTVVGLAYTSSTLAQNKQPVPRQVTAADMPRIPHTPARDAPKTFKLARGFQFELVAAEPLVSDPVDACFDEFGRMYVAEMHGYPFSQEPTKLNPAGGGLKNAGIIRLLEDTDGDGRMDESHVFADKLSWPTSVRCYNGGVFVIAPLHLYYLKDTDGDHQADVREIILSGFGRDNVQSVANGLEWGLDNKLYFAAGRNPKRLTHRGKKLPSLAGGDLRFDPQTERFEQVTGGLQFGHSMDEWGTRFVCSNSNHIQQVIFPQEYLSRNPYFAPSGLVRSIANDGASARVYRISPPEPWRIIRQKWRAAAKGYKLVINKDGGWEFLPLDPSKKKGAVPTEYPVGFFTSATGITIYRGDAYPPAYHGNAFVGDVGGNLVHRKRVDTERVVYKATRADQGTEFARSTDNWFRPVNFVNAPDGSLFVLDMYRETVEHPYSIPDEIKKFLHLTSGVNRGRIYRLVSPGMKRRKITPPGKLSNSELVAQLASTNGWHRATAQRLLWERQDQRVVADLEKLLETNNNPLGCLHALYTLQGLNALQVRHLERGLRDKHPRVRVHAIKLSEPFLASSPTLLEEATKLASDNSEHVRFQLAFSLGEANRPQAIAGLATLAKDPRSDDVMTTAILSSVGQSADQLASALIQDGDFWKQKRAARIVSQLAAIAGAHPNSERATSCLVAMTRTDLSLSHQQLILTGLAEGLKRRGSTIARLLTDQQVPAQLRRQVSQLFRRATETAADKALTLQQRASAIRLLGFADLETAAKHLKSFLSPQTPQPLQRAAVSALSEQESDQVAQHLLGGWRTYSPQIRRDVVDALLSKPARIEALLTAVKTKRVNRGDIERDKKQLLLKHPNSKIRSRTRKLFSAASSNRAKVVADHQSVLQLEADASRGLAVFKKKCAVCHQVAGVGHRVAPDLNSVQNKSIADLLVAILDPNREAQPNFNVYSVVTERGRIYTGVIAAETANSITLRRAEGKQDVILRSNIDRLVATGLSLMPEGLEKDLSPQDLADVIAFVKAIKPAEEGKRGGGAKTGRND